MRTRLSFVALLALLLVAVSCTKSDFSVDDVHVQPYITQGNQMGLSVFFLTKAKDPSSIQMSVKDPSGNLSWSMDVTKVQYDGSDYYGSSEIAMPYGVALPVGDWSADLLYKDGSTRTITFNVSYSDKEGALQRFYSRDSEVSWFDVDSNLTVLP